MLLDMMNLWWLFTCLIPLTVLGYELSEHQVPFTLDSSKGNIASQPQLELSTEWSCLGPVPAGMREQHLGANPLASFGDPISWLRNSTDSRESPDFWLPSFSTFRAYDAGHGQSNFTSTKTFEDGHRQKHTLTVAFPDIRWNELRSYQGWAALQWQAYLSSPVKIDCGTSKDCSAQISIERGNEFALVSQSVRDEDLTEVEWYRGDWYSYNEQFRKPDSQTSSDEPPHPYRISVTSGDYLLVIRAVYEDRIFGDPWDDKETHGSPEVKLGIDVALDNTTEEGASSPKIVRVIQPDVVNGRFAGWGCAIDLVNRGKGELTIDKAEARFTSLSSSPLSASISASIRLKPDQTRIIPVRIQQSSQLVSSTSGEQKLTVRLCGHDHRGKDVSVEVPITLKHINLDAAPDSRESSGVAGAFTFTYLSELGGVEVAAAVAPSRLPAKSSSSTRDPVFDSNAPVALLLHGAGGNVLESSWPRSFPRQEYIWAVLPQGIMPWGFDWQLNSHIVARNALQALSIGATTLFTASPGDADLWDSRGASLAGIDRAFNLNRTIVLGHSNGGQGAWHYITKRPNEVVAGVVAAGYIKMGDYVGFDWHVGRQHTDPALNGLLRSSLSSFENDLHASNAVGIPLLVKYGEADTNVPTWHSRSMASLIATWNRVCIGQQSIASKLVSVSAVPEKPHWWDEVFLESDVIDFLAAHARPKEGGVWQFSDRNYTVARVSTLDPSETGAVGPWRIHHVINPGRLGRLTVTLISPNSYVIDAVNVDGVLFLPSECNYNIFSNDPPPRVQIGETVFNLTDVMTSAQKDGNGHVYFNQEASGAWSSSSTMKEPVRWSRPMGPMLRALNSTGPLQIVLPSRCTRAHCERYRSVAKRFAQSVLLYGRVDSKIMMDTDVLLDSSHIPGKIAPNSLDSATVVVLGGPEENLLARYMSSTQPLPVFVDGKVVRRVKHIYTSPCLGFTTLAPHPMQEHDRSLAINIWGSSVCGIEVAGRLLPVTTGSQIPEYAVVDGVTSSWQGAGGLYAAGWYDADWKFSPYMAYP